MRESNLLHLAAATAAFVLLRLITPYAHIFGGVADLIIFTTLFMATQILVIRYICALQISFSKGGIAFLLSLGLFSGLLAARLVSGSDVLLGLPIDLARIAAASFLGYIVSFALKDKNIVLPVAIFAAFLDAWTVFLGPTKHFVATAPQVVQQVSAPIPIPGGHGQIVSFIGPADFVFLAVFFGVIYRLKMEPARTYWLLFPLLTIAMLAVSLLPYFEVATGIPGLAPMALGVIIANYRHFKLRKQELWSVIIISAILLLAFVTFLLYRAWR